MQRMQLSSRRLLPVFLCGAILATAGGFAQIVRAADPSEPVLMRKQYSSDFLGVERQYWLYLPRGYEDDPARQWPVILFLHGGGERGDDLDLVMKHGPHMEATE